MKHSHGLFVLAMIMITLSLERSGTPAQSVYLATGYLLLGMHMLGRLIESRP
jgi:hypothetical protein